MHAGHLLSNHVAVEIDGNVKRFDREGLRQLQYNAKTLAVETFYITTFFNCYVIAQQVPRPPTCAVAMSLYQITS